MVTADRVRAREIVLTPGQILLCQNAGKGQFPCKASFKVQYWLTSAEGRAKDARPDV